MMITAIIVIVFVLNMLTERLQEPVTQ